MAACDATTLMPDAKCLLCFSDKQVAVITASLLCKLLQILDPMASCDPATLLTDANSLLYLTTRELGAVQVSLLCKIITAAESGAFSGVTCGDVDPVADPGVPCCTYYNRATSDLFYWDDNDGTWYKLVD